MLFVAFLVTVVDAVAFAVTLPFIDTSDFNSSKKHVNRNVSFLHRCPKYEADENEAIQIGVKGTDAAHKQIFNECVLDFGGEKGLLFLTKFIYNELL